MRISDWSSDVCSSDLALTLVPICPHTLSDRSIVVNGKQTVRITLRGAPNTVAMLTCDGQTAETLHAGESFEVSKAAFRLHLVHQIGRASCRERVCQYV